MSNLMEMMYVTMMLLDNDRQQVGHYSTSHRTIDYVSLAPHHLLSAHRVPK